MCLTINQTDCLHNWVHVSKYFRIKGMLFCSVVVSGSETPWTAAPQASLSLTISQILPKFTCTESVMPSNHLILFKKKARVSHLFYFVDISPLYLFAFLYRYKRASQVAQMVKNLPVMQETWVPSLDQEDPLEKGMATHSGILAWRIPWAGEPGGLQSMGSQESDRIE